MEAGVVVGAGVGLMAFVSAAGGVEPGERSSPIPGVEVGGATGGEIGSSPGIGTAVAAGVGVGVDAVGGAFESQPAIMASADTTKNKGIIFIL